MSSDQVSPFQFKTNSFKNSFDPSSDPLDPHHKPPPQNQSPSEPSAPSAPNQSSTKSFFNSNNIESPLNNFNFNANRRVSVSAEALNPNNFGNDNWKPPVHQLTHDQLTRLNASVIKNFLFSQLDEDSLRTIIFALEEKKYLKGSEIIKQGDEGDFFYIVENGIVDYLVNNKIVNTSSNGSSFGELALMYNSPRAATVIAKTDCILWALDRMTFRRILLEGTAKKRSLYENFLKEVPVLQSLSTYERSKLADALNTENFKSGENVVTEGEAGENFYFIEDGTAEVVKNGHGVVTNLKKGDYFGELALLYDSPRQATVRAITPLKVVSLNKSGFQRLLGPAVDVLKLHDPTKN
ncbi:hypothetical protein C6P42_002061 [Pichia californica]|nr:hypothetical protein C6P42_002061 [[Candida] californica]